MDDEKLFFISPGLSWHGFQKMPEKMFIATLLIVHFSSLGILQSRMASRGDQRECSKGMMLRVMLKSYKEFKQFVRKIISGCRKEELESFYKFYGSPCLPVSFSNWNILFFICIMSKKGQASGKHLHIV